MTLSDALDEEEELFCMRGIIVMPAPTVSLPDSLIINNSTDMQLLRTWMLYWDEIVYPEAGNLLHVDLGYECQYLQTVGVFRRHRFHTTGGKLVREVIRARSSTFDQLEAKQPGSWALASGPGAWNGPEDETGRALQVKLVGALPVPNRDVPLDDILSFREKRKEQRESLMRHIDETYQSVLAAPDRPLAEHDAIERLTRSARDQLEVMQEFGFEFKLADLAADFNVAAAGIAAVGAIGLGATWPMVVGNSLLAGASLTIANIMGMRNSKVTDTPFRYVASYHQEVFHSQA